MKAVADFLGSMAGRIFLVLLLGFGLFATMALGAANASRHAIMERLFLERLADRTQEFVSVLDATPEPARGRLALQGTPGVRATPAKRAGGEPDANLTEMLAARLGPSAAVSARQAGAGACPLPPRGRMMGVGPGPGFGAGRPEPGPWPGRGENRGPPAEARCWIVDLRLADGAPIQLAIDAPPRMQDRSPLFDPLYLAILAVGAALIAFLIARMTARPLMDLAVAARGLGSDLDRSPLPETGPTEVREAAHAFNAMQGELRRHLAQRTQMLAAITHDLQTPLTRLRLRLEKVADPELRERLIGDLADTQSLVKEGLDFARSADIAEGAVILDVDSLAEALADDEADAGRPVSFTGGCGRDLLIRPQALRRCLANLIDNAVKYGGSAAVSAAVEGDAVVIRVRDHGPGIPEDRLEDIFEPLVRLEESRSRETGGSGLGLTIARGLAHRNGADLILRNHPDGGAEAVLTLPLKPIS